MKNGEKHPGAPAKMSRDQFIGDSAAQLADVVKGTLTTNYDFGAIAVFLTVVIATLDQQVGEDVIVPMSVSATDEQMENWANRVLPKLNPFGIHDPRLRTSEFWSDLIRRLEVELKGFTGRAGD